MNIIPTGHSAPSPKWTLSLLGVLNLQISRKPLYIVAWNFQKLHVGVIPTDQLGTSLLNFSNLLGSFKPRCFSHTKKFFQLCVMIIAIIPVMQVKPVTSYNHGNYFYSEQAMQSLNNGVDQSTVEAYIDTNITDGEHSVVDQSNNLFIKYLVKDNQVIIYIVEAIDWLYSLRRNYWKKGACHREQFVNKSSFGLTGIVLRHIIRKIVFIGNAVYYDDQRPYIYRVRCLTPLNSELHRSQHIYVLMISWAVPELLTELVPDTMKFQIPPELYAGMGSALW